jgi:hypothetical protein
MAPGFPALSPTEPGSLTRIDVRHFEARPRLALIIREGDPAPALALAVFTTEPPAHTVALATVVEQRLLAAGFDVSVVVDRIAFRVLWWPAAVDRVEGFVAAAGRCTAARAGAGSLVLVEAASTGVACVGARRCLHRRAGAVRTGG